MIDGSDFSSLFEGTYDDICRYLVRRGIDPSVSRELASDVFEAAWRKWPPAPPEGMRPWLFKTASFVLINYRRKSSHEADTVERLREHSSATGAPATEQVMDVIGALKSLGEADQEVLRLTAWEGLTAREIGLVIGVTTNAAAVRLHRARRRLRAALQLTTSDHDLEGADHG